MNNIALDRKTPPPFLRSTSFELITPVKVTTPNGLHLQFVSGGSQNVVRIELVFNAGRWFENKWGVSHFTSNLLSKGTKNKNSFEIAQIFDQYGAHLEISPGVDFVSIALYSLVKNLDDVLELLREVVMEPTFPEKEIAQSKSIFLQNLKVNNEKTSFQASKILKKNVFGEEHPYGKELSETDASNIERGDLVNFHNQYFKHFQIIVSGRLEGSIERKIIDIFSDFSSATGDHIDRVFSNGNISNQAYIEKDGSLQTSIRLGKKSLVRSHADYVDVLFLNHILGGYFGSRLMKNIREEKGLTYGIHSSLHALSRDSYLVIGADVNKQNVRLAIQEIKNEIKKLRDEPIRANELEIAQYQFIGGLQSEITTPFAHADKLKNILLHNLDQRYYQNMINRISTITPADLLNVANKYFDEETFLEVAVG